MTAEPATWVELRVRCRRRWVVALAAAMPAGVAAASMTRLPGLLAFPTVGFAVGMLTGLAAGTRLLRQYGAARGREAYLGEDIEIRVAPPSRRDWLLPLVLAAGVAVLVAGLGHERHQPLALAAAVFAAFAAGAGGVDAVGAIVIGRWERGTALRLFAERRTTMLSSAPPVLAAVATGATPVRPRRGLAPALVVLALIVPLAWVMTLGVARARQPWLRDLPTGALPATTSHVDPRLGAVATSLAGRQVQVRCWSPGDWSSIQRAQGRPLAGFAELATDRINLAPGVCGPLLDLQRGDEPGLNSAAGYRMSFAVTAIGHEAGHLVLGLDEARAECFGLRSADRTATLLGADAGYAFSLQLYYREHILPHRAPTYRAGGCPA